jgi:hypothetical protein
MTYLNNPVVQTEENDIAKFTRIKPLNKMLQPTLPLPKYYGYKVAPFYPMATGVIGSAQFNGIGTSRAVGGCKFHTGPRQQYPIFRNKDIRLQFPHLQRMVADVIQIPPKMYGEFTQPSSMNLVR